VRPMVLELAFLEVKLFDEASKVRVVFEHPIKLVSIPKAIWTVAAKPDGLIKQRFRDPIEKLTSC
jgi:hypothetical protein